MDDVCVDTRESRAEDFCVHGASSKGDLSKPRAD